VAYDVETDLSQTGFVYVGQAVPGSATSSAVWKIKRITEGVNGTSIDWANGTDASTNVWDDRLTLSYGP